MAHAICLLAAGVRIVLGSSLTLAWTHSIEKTEWQEDWRSTDAGLALTEARVKGSGAGMEPPPDARLVDGFYRWTPKVPPVDRVTLRRSGATSDWKVCTSDVCRTMSEILGRPIDPVILAACDDER